VTGAPPPPDADTTGAFDETILQRIGHTPLVRLHRLPGPDAATVLCKCEHLNPGGSVKDRAALAMVEAAEREGRLIPGQSVIVEATSGNTGIGLALVAAVKGYRLILTMPENMSEERRAVLRAFGAEIHLTPARQVMAGAVQKADALAAKYPGAFMPQQFKNPMNPDVHRRTTGPEIVADLGPRIPDAFVAGVGTGGTITGVGEVLLARYPDIALVAVEPQASAVLSGGLPGPHGIQGIGAGFVPEVLRRDLLSDVRQVTEAEARAMRGELARREGLMVGISSGAAVFAAIQVARELGVGKIVVTLLPDSGERYVSTAERASG
jgi:cysteine synthase A